MTDSPDATGAPFTVMPEPDDGLVVSWYTAGSSVIGEIERLPEIFMVLEFSRLCCLAKAA